MRAPSDEYSARLDARRTEVQRCRRANQLIANLRLATVAVLVLAAWLALGPGVIAGPWAVPPFGVFIALAVHHERIRRRTRRAQRAVLFYENGLARIEDRWAGTGNARRVLEDEKHLYAADLDIFGKGSLFELLCSARTRSGEETLAAWLCAPASRSEILARQQALEELRSNIDLREDLAVLGEEVESGTHPEMMKRWGRAPLKLDSAGARIVAPFLAAAAAYGLISYFFFNGSGWIALAAVAAEAAFAFPYRRRVAEVAESVDQPAKDLQILTLVLSRLEREEFRSGKLRELRAALDTEGKRPSQQIARLARLIELLDSRRNMIFAVIGPILLWTTQMTFAIEAWRRRSGPAIGQWLDVVGEMEALCALAGYAYEHPSDPFPEIVEGGAVFAGEGLRHPLLPGAQSIANAVRLGGDLRILVISGSNMSGKSTLLRTTGINIVLALAGAPVRASRLRVSLLRIGATIRVMDSLQAGTSRFYAEIQRIRDIMDLTKGETPAFFLLDEILHGTNSHDRAVGAESIVRGLVARGAIGLVTTHDLALARVADALTPKAENVHFEDHFEDGRMVFDYRLRPGVVTKSNALELMRAVGLDV